MKSCLASEVSPPIQRFDLRAHFGTSPQFWLGLQADYDLDIALDHLGNRLEREVRVMTTAG